MKALEAYRAYGGKRTNRIQLAIIVNGIKVDSAWRSLGNNAAGGPVPNYITFRGVNPMQTFNAGDCDTVRLGE